ncbi:MAG: HAD family hydrolase [Phocaeicola sp.]
MMNITGIIFDYGGTIDTNSRHWAEVLWEAYETHKVPVSKTAFRNAYVFGERALAKNPYITPNHTFRELLHIKTELQIGALVEEGNLSKEDPNLTFYAKQIAETCYKYVLHVLTKSRPVVEKLSKQYKLVLVSNFYGNIETILKEFCLESYFDTIIESAVVGVRKPDPAIYQLGVDAMQMPAENILAVGDSFSKDVVPAKAVGCKVAWLSGEGWGDEEIDPTLPDITITDITELLSYLIK